MWGCLLRFLIYLHLALLLSGCFTLPASPLYQGPPPRPPELESYYHKPDGYEDFKESVEVPKQKYDVKRIELNTVHGAVQITYFQLHKPSDSLVLVFPVLGGKDLIERHFARYFARHGYDSAIVARNNDFKDPKNFLHIEEVMRDNLVRDRLALDFFEREYGKRRFATFGISRGALNVAMTAGVDPRLKYNVMALGGSDIVKIFRHTDQPGIAKYKKKVIEANHLTEEQFFQHLKNTVRTDPKNLAQYLDARETLLIFALFDQTVPILDGMRLRRQIGKPRTIFVAAGHYTALLYTQFLKMIRPNAELASFPFDYIETKALEFYDHKFGRKRTNVKGPLYEFLSLPLSLVGQAISAVF